MFRFGVTHHKSLLNAKVVMNDFGQGSQAVGGAGGIAVSIKTDMVTIRIHSSLHIGPNFSSSIQGFNKAV